MSLMKCSRGVFVTAATGAGAAGCFMNAKFSTNNKVLKECVRKFSSAVKGSSSAAKESFTKSDGDLPLCTETFNEIFTKTTAKYQDRDAFVSFTENVKHTHSEVKVRMDAFALGLLTPGRLWTGERFMCFLPDTEEKLSVYLGSARIGALFYPVDFRLPTYALFQKIRRERIKVLAMPETVGSRNYIDDFDDAAPEYFALIRPTSLRMSRFPTLRRILHTGSNEWPAMMQLKDIAIEFPSHRTPHLWPTIPDEQQVSQQSPILAYEQMRVNPVDYRGLFDPLPTTAVHTVFGVVNTGQALVQACAITRSDRVAALECPAAYYPLVVGVLRAGAVLVQPYFRYSLPHLLESIEKDKLTVLFLNFRDASHLASASVHPADVSTLRTIVVVDGLTPSVERGLRTRFPHAKQVYGLWTVPDLPGQLLGLVRIRERKSVPLPYTEAKIVDDDDRVVPTGTVGKLKTRGPHVSSSVGGPAVWVDKNGWLDSLIRAKMNDDATISIEILPSPQATVRDLQDNLRRQIDREMERFKA